ncbi:hypothetical protein Plo01_34320 [Planobispora longispora]|uniref:Uncharacterized protein n=2 Tax=Planobispora longispora TaxID=28887 RepID=A0A8J3RL68_9ACTN|nr:hypothetical protein GCM10020093_027750 [Planobispora longispora]GIH77003.1 hypothetical protein Plo01_34320 [Planobispora longispora]
MDAGCKIRHAGSPYAEDRMQIVDILLVLMVWAVWVVLAALLFFFLYWTIRLAIRHEKRRLPTPREIADQERRERMAAERVAQYRPRQRRPK